MRKACSLARAQAGRSSAEPRSTVHVPQVVGFVEGVGRVAAGAGPLENRLVNADRSMYELERTFCTGRRFDA